MLTNPSSLSYFMEFMDRRHRSLLVQFWLTVESFKNPLESVDSSSDDDDDEAVLDPARSATLREDISMMNDLYFSGSAPDPVLAAISQKHVQAIHAFALSEDVPTSAEESRVRRSVMLAQRQVEREMEQDFEEFQRSELWFRVLGDVELQGRREAAASSHSTATESSAMSRTTSRVSQQSSSSSDNSVRAPIPRYHSSPHIKHLKMPAVQRPTALAISSPVTPIGAPLTATPRPVASASTLELFMSPASDSPSTSTTRAPLFDDPADPEVQQLTEQSRRMEAIQAALTDIIALDKKDNPTEAKPSNILQRSMTDSMVHEKKRVLFDDEINEEEHADDDVDEGHGSFQLAGPGDLQLSHEIARLASKIETLQSQDAMLDTLIKKAELTGDAQELRLLRKSKSSLTRELRELGFQKTQYEQQESANRLLSDRTKVAIVNSTVGEEDGKSVVRYLIEVQQLAPDGSFTSGWVVARRYNEFFYMHNKLRERYALVRNLDFPGKRLVTNLTQSFVDHRRVALEKYLQVCHHEEARLTC